jgi:hypothetical protein
VAVVENMATFSSGAALRQDDTAAWQALGGDFEGVLGMQQHELVEALANHEEAQQGKIGSDDDSALEFYNDSYWLDKDGGRRADPSIETYTAKLRARVLALVARERAGASGPHEHHIFGRGHAARLRDMWGIDTVVQLPLDAAAATHGDGGVPLVVDAPCHPLSVKFLALADAVVREVTALRSRRRAIHPTVRFDAASNQLLVDEGCADTTESVYARELRLKCR